MMQPVALPAGLLDALEGLPGFDRQAFQDAHAPDRMATAVRVHPYKFSKYLAGTGSSPGFWLGSPSLQKVPWSRHGLYLPSRPVFAHDPLWHAGAYYVQEPSSMALETALEQCLDLSGPLRALDLCAAPGGKSTLLAGILSPDSLVVSNEVIRSRGSVLAENMTKWGMPGTVLTAEDPSSFQRLPGFFDLVLVDAPCSGSGLFRKQPAAAAGWSPEQVRHCSLRQQRILTDVLDTLKPGGLLVYATCSYSKEENEDILDWLAGRFPLESVRLSGTQPMGITESQVAGGSFGYRFYPDKTAGEGFFIGCLRHRGTGKKARTPGGKKRPYAYADRQQRTRLSAYTDPQWPLDFLRLADNWLAFPQAQAAALEELAGQVRIRQAGIAMGRMIREALVPAPALALGLILNGEGPSLPLDREQALRYLRKEALEDYAAAEGWVTARFAGYPLGWAKAVQGRLNNYYPAAWRLRE